MRIVFIGDFMLSGVQSGKQLKVSQRLSNKLSNFDLRVATLETAVGTYHDIDNIKMLKSEVAVWSKPEDLHKLTDLNINVVSLANNHACDCGVDMMLDLRVKLQELGITTIGAGNNQSEAMEPAIFEKDGESVAIIACCQDNPISLRTLHFATENAAGIYKLDEVVLIHQIQELKKKHTYVAVVVHWGIEHKWLPEIIDVDLGEKLIDAGADMIIGGHPHHIQPLVTYKERPIYYSLGNFYFPSFCLDKVSNTYYPEEEELKCLPVFCWMAPERRNFAMRYFWKYYGRLGMIASIGLCEGTINTKKLFSVYKNGRISESLNSILHTFILSTLSRYVGKEKSNKINILITRANHIAECTIFSLFMKKYRFFNYIKKQKFD